MSNNTKVISSKDLKKLKQCIAFYEKKHGKNKAIIALCKKVIAGEQKQKQTQQKLDSANKNIAAWKNVSIDHAGSDLKNIVQIELLLYKDVLHKALKDLTTWYINNYCNFLKYAYPNPTIASPPLSSSFAKKLFGNTVTEKIAEGLGKKSANKLFKVTLANTLQHIPGDAIVDKIKKVATDKFGATLGTAIGTIIVPGLGTVIGAGIGIALDYAVENTLQFLNGDPIHKKAAKTADNVQNSFRKHLDIVNKSLDKIIQDYEAAVIQITNELGKTIDQKIKSLPKKDAQVFSFNIKKYKQEIKKGIRQKVSPHFVGLNKIDTKNLTYSSALIHTWTKENLSDSNQSKNIPNDNIHNAIGYLQKLDGPENKNKEDDVYDLPNVNAKTIPYIPFTKKWNYVKGQIDPPYYKLRAIISKVGLDPKVVDQKLSFLKEDQLKINKQQAANKKSDKTFSQEDLKKYKSRIEKIQLSFDKSHLKDSKKFLANIKSLKDQNLMSQFKLLAKSSNHPQLSSPKQPLKTTSWLNDWLDGHIKPQPEVDNLSITLHKISLTFNRDSLFLSALHWSVSFESKKGPGEYTFVFIDRSF